MTPVLNVIGTGKLGTTLPRLFGERNLVAVGDLYNRHLESGRQAARFIGAGTARDNLAAMAGADLWLVAVPDDAIAATARQMAEVDRNWNQCIVFHCSGRHDAGLLAPLQQLGADVASVHPAHSFANPARSLNEFAGTCCTLEGDRVAVERLTMLFEAIGGQTLTIDSSFKPLYHAATAVASNYLVALADMAEQMLESAGLERKEALAVIAPLMRGSLANAATSGPEAALTGPIVRGDHATVASHLDAIAERAPHLLAAYRELGRLTTDLARRSDAADTRTLDQILSLLQNGREHAQSPQNHDER